MTTVEELHFETWVEYGFCTFVIVLRLAVRTRLLGFKGLQWDDILMPVAWGFLTTMSIAAHIVSMNGDNANLGDDATRLEIVADHPELAKKLRTGSQFFMVGWFTYTSFLWTLKLRMLFLLKRITQGLWIAKIVAPLMGTVLVFWVAILAMILSLCRPFYKYWQVYPDPGVNCTPETHVFYITVLMLNLATDACIVLIPLTVVAHAQMTPYKRLGFIALLSAGVFIMIAAVLRVIFVFTVPEPATPALWACRETLVAVCAVNAPLILPVFRRKFWNLSYGRAKPSADSRGGGNIELTDRRKAFRRYKHPLDIDATFLPACKDRTTVDVQSSSMEYILPGNNGIHITTDSNIESSREL